MDKQYYAIRVNRSLIQKNWDQQTVDRIQKTAESRELNEHEKKHLEETQRRVRLYDTSPKVFGLHSGGKGNGACGGLYEKHQLNRILGRYAEGTAEAVPVSFGLTQVDSDSNAEDAHFLRCLESQGVDNWGGFDYAREQFQEEGGGNDD